MTVVNYGVDNGIATISLNRPQKLNAINYALLTELVAALEAANDDPEVAVILLRGEGRAFSAGDDLEELQSATPDLETGRHFVDKLQSVTRLIMLGTKPVVCAAQGWMVGGGASWVLNADFVVVADDAVMVFPEARHQLFNSGGASILLAERCGPDRAAELLWLGERVDAASMLRDRIVHRVVARDALDDSARARAEEVAALPKGSRQRYKAARAAAVKERLEKALDVEAESCIAAAMDLYRSFQAAAAR